MLKITLDRHEQTNIISSSPVYNNFDWKIPVRIKWTEFTEDSIVWHYSTIGLYCKCTNRKIKGFKK
jgi:hypothetical protein